ncbi:alcohol dehydrogenase catalytic domain-containing protein [Solirubrobacter sp. CPCC 204708]|uniref:Zinc-binding dehydrogenase n=1 Tax=Solirubrobacter deserti TaxID=2282478 RepID=A0ABT4RIX3_9ACTN|nr:zinc-binding dehydrogenase [Solirubrobacter deserti]MBE2320805.1 alcohol dehydrogenase catalytic domain-containing protein [Solirubrobacter deserti]MDA0138440.1 zinc-binding dehydrogenase [Solirubrobacter deserti]
MWAYAIIAPGRLERVEVPVPVAGAGQRLVRLRAGGICGSDLPMFRGRRSQHFIDNTGDPGFPLHEVVGDAEDGTRVVGWPAGHRGLAEWFVADADQVIAVDSDLSDVEATVIQPLCTVLHALDRLGDVTGRRAAVIGLGSIGLLFAHVLSRRGALVSGVDRVDRRAFAEPFGLREVRWDDATALPHDAFHVVIEAVGHQTHTLSAAVDALAPDGTLYAFGVPDDTHYPFPFTPFFRKNGTLLSGVTVERASALRAARAYLLEHRELLGAYITDVLPVTRAQEAFELAVAPTIGRAKIVLSVADVDA